MRIELSSPAHLSYCTNVHPGESWDEVLFNLKAHVPAIKAEVSPDHPFGIGLRLSAAAAASLCEPGRLEMFKAFLKEHALYVFTINGFPFGRFHDARVKEKVYLPDWQDERRLAYSNQLADILAELLPADVEGSVSTVPGAFKARVPDEPAVARMVANLVKHAAYLAALFERSGRLIRLALEPEPCCFLETIDETIRFFEDQIFSRETAQTLAALAGCSNDQAHELLRRHIGVCFDVCHAAVEFEEEDALERLVTAGIAVPKIQLSSALKLPRIGPETRGLLEPFDDGVYLHQVVERNEDGLRRYADLDEAFATLASGDLREWRVHFHVPVFLEECGAFATTQSYLKTILTQHRRRAITTHLEVETYTWGVLPQAKRQESLAGEIAREIQWVKRQLGV